MLHKISRYLIVIVTIFVLSNVLPGMYDTLFDVRIDTPFVTYSIIKEDFIINSYENGEVTYTDTKGNFLTRQEVDELQPYLYHYQLTNDGRMPDTLMGEKTDLTAFSQEFFYTNIESYSYKGPDYGLYILFESQSGRVGVEYPEDFFRLRNDIQFINCRTNKVNQEKSDLFTNTMQEAGFVFPAQLVAGIPFDFKSVDDGNFLTDSNGDLYHLKMAKGEPYFVKIAIPADMVIKHIDCVDNRSYREFLAYIVSEENKIYLLKTDDYSLVELPISDYVPEEQRFTLIGDYKTRHVSLTGKDYVKAYALDKEYNLVDTYAQAWPIKQDMIQGKASRVLFPFTLNFWSQETRFIKLSLKGYKGYGWIVLNVVFAGLFVYYCSAKKKILKHNVLDIILVALSGLYGFIAVLLFPNKKY